MENSANIVTLVGTLDGKPELSHEGRYGRYFAMPLSVERTSGAVDTLPLLIRETLLRLSPITQGDKVRVMGEVRSFNNHSGEGNRLRISVFAHTIEICFGEDENAVFLTGTVCREPMLRITPMGRQICDLMLAVNRRYGRSDYIPCILWGYSAETGSLLSVGERLRIEGRLQSRHYLKTVESGREERIAYEVSASSLEILSE